MSSRVVRLDQRGRLVLPRDVREAMGLDEGSRLLVKLREDGVIELIPLDGLYERVSSVFRKRLKDWREEDHEASRLLEEMVVKRGDS